MDQGISPTDAFEAHLERGRAALSEVRETYSTLEMTRTVPDSMIEKIGDLERELDELDQTLDVTAEDVRLAEQASQRTSVLADVFAALDDHQRIVLEAELTRLKAYASGLAELHREIDLPEDLDSECDRLDRRLSMLQKLADSGRYGQVISNDRVSPGTIDADLRSLDSALTDGLRSDARATTYLAVAEDLLEDVHNALSGLNDANENKTTFSKDLKAVKDRIEDAETALKDGVPDQAVEDARIALEGIFMLHFQSARSSAEQHLAEELATVIREAEGAGMVDVDVSRHASEGNADALLAVIDDLVNTHVEHSVAERLNQLLHEHEGSVVRTAEATDFDVASIIEQLDRLYQQEYISDIEVVFER